MAFQNKYIVEFADYLNLNWKIEFQTNPWAGAVTTLKATGDPLHIEFLSDSDEFNDPIRPSKAIINVHSLTDFALLDFYSDQDFRIKCNIYCGANIYWTGFVVTGEHQEPYDMVPYPVKITCIDGLNYLKNYLYNDGATPPAYYNGRVLESQIILDILAKIQIVDFIEYINIYETAMDSTVDDSPMDQLKIDVDIFRDMYCYEVLIELLKKYNAVIRQVEGYIVIYRPTELAQATVYGRIFTAATTKTSTNFAPAQQISRTAGVTNLKDIPGSALMIRPPVKNITINQDYGYKESWLDNWKFPADTFTAGTTPIENWTVVGIKTSYAALGRFLPAEKNGVTLTINSAIVAAPDTGSYLYQIFGTYSLVSTDLFAIEFGYLLYNTTGSLVAGAVINIEIKNNGGIKFLYEVDGDTCAWSNTQAYITITVDSPVGSTGWIGYSRRIVGIPSSSTYQISLFAVQEDICLAIKDIKFYTSSSEIVSMPTYGSIIPKKKKSWLTINGGTKWGSAPAPISTEIIGSVGSPMLIKDVAMVVLRQYLITNAVNGKELELNYLLGDVADANIDNVIEQFAGSLATWTSGMYIANALAWNTRGGSENDPVIEIIGGEIGHQYSRPKQLIQFALIETDPADTVLNIAGSVQDILNWHKKINTVTLTGSSGTAVLVCNGVGDLATWNTSLTQTATNFAAAHVADYLAVGVTLTSSGATVIFTLVTPGADFIGPNTVQNVSGNLSGTPVTSGYRKFVFNAGELDAKMRTWSADLLEIINN